MTETDSTPTPADVQQANTEAVDTDSDQPAEGIDWKAKFEKEREHSRKWEKYAKANEKSAERLAELEEAQMSEQEKADARVKAAEDRAEAIEAQNRVAETALEFGLTKEDADLLHGVSDPEKLTALAERLSKNKTPALSMPPVPTEGNNSRPAALEQEFMDHLTLQSK